MTKATNDVKKILDNIVEASQEELKIHPKFSKLCDEIQKAQEVIKTPPNWNFCLVPDIESNEIAVYIESKHYHGQEIENSQDAFTALARLAIMADKNTGINADNHDIEKTIYTDMEYLVYTDKTEYRTAFFSACWEFKR